MNVLGVESSCDETAAAVVANGRHIISNIVNSQIDIHKAFNGVVPEVAARSHLEVVIPVIDEAVQAAGRLGSDRCYCQHYYAWPDWLNSNRLTNRQNVSHY